MNLFKRGISEYLDSSLTTTSFVLGISTAMLINRYMPEIKENIIKPGTNQARNLSQQGQQMISNRMHDLERQLNKIENKLNNFN